MKVTKVLAALAVACGCVYSALAFTTGTVPSDGVYKFAFGSANTPEGYRHVGPDAVYDAAHQYTGSTFTYGFLGTQSDSYQNDVPWSLPKKNTAIDGFSVVQKQWIKLRDLATGIAGPLKADYEPAGASEYAGRYPVRFSFSAEEGAYYAVTCTVVNVSSTTNADVSLFSERCHIQAHHLALKPGETRTFAWSVELFPNVFKNDGTYHDDAINVVVVGENAGLKSLVAVREPQKSGTIRGVSTAKMNVGKTMWLCDDSTGTDQAAATPFFSLQNYCGVGSGISRWAPANIAIRNQGEGGLATNANAHRQSCQLKPGDYLYVEYGHNENGPQSYTNNLEMYLTDVNTAGAKLVIVSAVERRYSWNGESQTWNRSLGGYAAAAEAWVEDKIAHGATNVAFVNLNKRYNDWQNEEIRRINTVNPSISLFNAISFYYRCAKGAHVDDTHINTAGTDQAAYWVWQEIVDRVAAGQADDATDSQKIQAAVLADLVDGYQGTVGLGSTETNIAWTVTDNIVKAGDVPNEYWDTPVTSGFDYANTADVASVDTTMNDDGTITISGVTMRILNPGNYYKAVIDITDAEGVTQRYYTYSNYDVGGAGKMPGELVTPEKSGFITNDFDKATISAADLDVLTVPAGGKAEVWMAVASASTWQVGDNEPCSPKYPVLRPESVLAQDDCSSTNAWKLTSNAVDYSAASEDGAITFHSSGVRSDKKNASFNLYLPLTSDMADGRYRITFRAYLDAGHTYYRMGDGSNAVTLLELSGTTAIGYQSTSPLVTVTTDDEGNAVPQAVINTGAWMDVDMIIDRTNARAWISVGGSDYLYWTDIKFLPGSFSGKTWNCFNIAAAGGSASYGAVDEVKVEKLPSVTYNNVTGRVASSDAALGTVTINGYSQDALTIFEGRDFLFSATVSDPDFYYFAGWQDDAGNTVSTNPNFYIPVATSDCSYTATFARYADEANRVVTWDFANYQGDFTETGTVTTNIDQNMSFVLTSGDAMTGSGLIWANSANSGTGNTIASEKYIVYAPTEDGTFALTFSADANASSRTPTVIINAADSKSDCTSKSAYASKAISEINTSYTLTAEFKAGQTYYIWPYSYNWSGAGFAHNYTITSITYTYARPTTNRVTVNEGETLAQADPIKSNTGTITKKGAGTLVLVGTNTFACPLTVAEGTVKLGDYTDIEGLQFDKSASEVTSDELSDEANLITDDAVMNGRTALRGTNFTVTVGSATSSTMFLAAQLLGTYNYMTLMRDNWTGNYQSKITRHNNYNYLELNYPNKYVGNANMYLNGEAGLPIKTIPAIYGFNCKWAQGTAFTIGTTNDFAFGEIVSYSRVLSANEFQAANDYLMYKWGITSSYTPISAEAELTVAAGATLDLDAQKPTVKSVTLEDGAILNVDYGTEGVVLTADMISVEGALVIKIDGETSTTLEAFVIANDDGTQSLKLVTPVYATLTVPVVANTTVQVTAGGRVWTVTDGAAQVPQGLPVTVTYSPVDGYVVENGTITLDALTGDAAVDASKVTVSELTCTWKGGARGDWSDADNWDTGTVPTLGTSKIAFTNDVTVTLPTTQTSYTEDNLSLNGKDVTFVGTADTVTIVDTELTQNVAFTGVFLITNNITGTATVGLKNATLRSYKAAYTFAPNLEIVEGTTNGVAYDTNWCVVTLAGALSGSGYLKCYNITKNTNGGVAFSGDLKNFTGTCEMAVSSGRPEFRFYNPATNGVNATWIINKTNSTGGSNNNYGYTLFQNAGETYRFGTLDLTLPVLSSASYVYKNVTVEAGYLDKPSKVAGSFVSSGCGINWVAESATLTNTTEKTAFITVTNGGTVSFGGVTTGIPTKLIFADKGGYIQYEEATFGAATNALADCTGPVGFDVPEGVTCVFDPDYIGEDITLMKAGEGILSVPENTVFASLSEAQQEKVTITGMAEGKRVKFTTDPETGKITVTAVDAKVEVPLFLTGGQSNTDGRIDNKEADQLLPDYIADGNANAYVTTGSGTFVNPFAPAVDKKSYWAYDAPLYYFLTENLGKIYVAKTSYGGTSVNPYVNNSGSGTGLPQYGSGYHWSADPTFLKATKPAGETFVGEDGVTYTGQSLLLKWMNNVDAAIDALVADGKTPVVKAIIWHQGESDKNNGSYATELTQMVTYVRDHLTAKLGTDCSKVPFFCGNIPRKSSLFSINIDKQFTKLAEDTTNGIFVSDLYDCAMQATDSKHFNAATAETFAKRMYNQMIDESVITGEKLEVSECVRKPDFGTEFVVNNTTTWSYENMSGDVANSSSPNNIGGMYYHGYNSNGRKLYIGSMSSGYTLDWTIGSDLTPLTTKKGVTCSNWWTEDKKYYNNIISTTSAGIDSTSYTHLIAVNVGCAGKFETFVATAGVVKLFFGGKLVASADAAESSRLVHLTYENATEGAYFIALQGTLLGSRFVPTTEQTSPITVTIPDSGVTTFGNLYNCSLVLPDGLAAYAVNVDPDNTKRLALTSLAAINLGDAVVLKGTPGTYTLTPGIGASYTTENLMVAQENTGIVAEMAGGDFVNYLVDADEDGNVTLTKSTGTTTLEAGKAFFSITTGDAHTAEDTLYEVLPPVRYTEEVAAGETKTVITPYEGDTVVLTKTGAGTLTLVGNNAFAGEVRVKAGTLKLGNPYTAAGTIEARYDPTLSETVSYTNGVFEKIADACGSSVVLQIGSPEQTPAVGSVDGILGGNTVFSGDKVRLSASAKFADGVKSVFMAWHPTENDDYLTPMLTSRKKYNIQRHNSSGSVYESNRNGTYYSAGIYGNGGAATVTMDADQLLFVNTNLWIYSGNDTIIFGSGRAAYIGEIVVYSTFLSDDQRTMMEDYLMAKWGIDGKTYSQIPTNAAVTVAAGATLDLGTQTPTVGTATFADSSVIAVDALTTEGTVVMKASDITLGKVVVKVAGEELADALATVFTDDYGIENLKLAAPTYVKLTVPTITDASVVVTANGTVRTVGEDGKYDVPTGLPVTVVYTSTRIGSAVTNGGFSYEEGITADTTVDTTDTKLERVATTYTWSDTTGDHKWSTVKNWKVGDSNAADYPSTLDTAVFPVCDEGVTNNVTVDRAVTVAAVKLDGSLRLGCTKYSSNRYTLTMTSMTGAGMFYMNNAWVGSAQPGLDISCNVTVEEGTSNRFASGDNANIEIHGDLHGTGTIEHYQNKTWSSLSLYGDNGDFAGTVSVGGSASSAVRDCLTYMTTNSASAKAKWNIKGSLGGNGMGPRVAGTYRYGTLQGSYYTYVSGVTLEVGARNEDCSFASRVGQNDSSKAQYSVAFGLRKVGSATLTYTGATGLADVAVEAGTLVVTNQTSFEDVSVASNATLKLRRNTPSVTALTLADGAIIDVDYAVEGYALITTASGVQCEGTVSLRLAGEATTALKLTISEDGNSLVVASAGPEVKPGEGEISPDPTAENTYVVTTETTNVTEVTVSNLPADATVKVPVNVATINGVTDTSKVKVISGNGTTEITGYLVITKVGNAVVVGDLPTSGTVYEEIEATTLNKTEPIALKDGEATITTGTTIKGLKYTLVEGKALNDMGDGDSKYGDGEAWKPATGKSGKLDNATSGFFKIRVSK